MTSHCLLKGSNRTLRPDSRRVGAVDRNEIASLTIRVRSKGDLTQLEKSIDKQYQIPLGDRIYLTREEFDQQYGAGRSDLALVAAYIRDHGLRVVHRNTAERCLVVRGKLGHLLNAFPADVQLYQRGAVTYRGRKGKIRLPKYLDGIITGIFGFDTHPKNKSTHRDKNSADIGPGGKKGKPATFFARRYNFPEKFLGKELKGTGQTIALIELGGGYKTSDLNSYFRKLKIKRPTIIPVSVDHGRNNPGKVISDDGEVTLDIEVAGTVAPDARIVVYFAPNKSNQEFINAVSAAIHDRKRKPDVISISWGEPEDHPDKQSIQNFHELFVAAAAMGITVCAASGDHGTAGVDASQWDGKIHVAHPAADDLVLACGGTQIDAHNKDVVWNDGTSFDKNKQGGGGWASGGGISRKFRIPSYQRKFNLPVSIAHGTRGRGVPDVAMSATNYFVRLHSVSAGITAGTSAVAPLMAALVARLNQAKEKNAGFLNPFLYTHARELVHDVTHGKNSIRKTVKGYSARKGWDACTGLGTPDGKKILKKL